MPQNRSVKNNNEFLTALIVKTEANDAKITSLSDASKNTSSFVSKPSTGAIGISTTLPDAKLHIKNSATVNGIGTVSVVVGSEVLQSDKVILRADIAGDLNNKYWILRSAQNARTFGVWYNVNNNGVNPYSGDSIEVAIATDETANAVAIATRSAIIIAQPEFFSIPAAVANVITIIRTTPGFTIAPIDVTVGGAWSTAQSVVGVANTDVIGSGTSFDTQLGNGGAILIGPMIYTIACVISATRLVLTQAPFSSFSQMPYLLDITAFKINTSNDNTVFTITNNGMLQVPVGYEDSVTSDQHIVNKAYVDTLAGLTGGGPSPELSASGILSDDNSSDTPLSANQSFVGIAVDVRQYTSVNVNIVSNVSSAPTGVSIEFSADVVNWDIKQQFTYSVTDNPYFFKKVQVQARWCRVVYTTILTQTTFRLQTIFHTNFEQESVKLDSSLMDAFGRLRISEPFTLLDLTHVNGKQSDDELELITGAATSTADVNASMITMATTATGSVSITSRRRGFYQPGKSLFWLITGVLNDNANASTVISRLGCYDNDDGYYFQYNNGIISIVERSSVTGSIVETIVPQSNWNIKKLNGVDGIILDVSKTLIFWATVEWLGVGVVTVGVVIGGIFYSLHKFRHANLLTTPYIRTASQPLRWEIISTGGAGRMKSICGTIMSEGGFAKLGNLFSANMGITVKNVNNEIPLIALRINSSFPKINIKLITYSVIATSTGIILLRFWKFKDTAATSILTNSSFQSAHPNSKAQYDVSSTAINTTGGRMVVSSYFSSKTDTSAPLDTDDLILTFNGGISELLVITGTSIGNNEPLVAALTWDELY